MTFPTISHFIESVSGIFIPLPIQTFGFFIVLAFVIGHYFIQKEFIRLEKLKIFKSIHINNSKSVVGLVLEYCINGLMSFLLGFKILYIINNYKKFTESPQDLIFSLEGNLFLGLLFMLFTLAYSVYKKPKNIQKNAVLIYPSQLSWNILFVAGLSGILGAKLFAVFEDIDYFIKDPISALFSFSGLTFYGGFIIGTASVILYAKSYNINIKRLADIFAPALILAYGIGRLGCHFSGDGDWGIIANMSKRPQIIPEWLWGYNFPHNVIEAGVKIENCAGKYCYELPYFVYPTALYEAIFCIFCFICLWKVKKLIKVSGILFCIYLVINGVERFLIEIIRITEKYTILGLDLTQAQIIGCLLILVGIFGIIKLQKIDLSENGTI